MKLSPDVGKENSGEVNGVKDWSETNGALPLARREPEGKDSDAKVEEEDDTKGSPVGMFISKQQLDKYNSLFMNTNKHDDKNGDKIIGE